MAKEKQIIADIPKGDVTIIANGKSPSMKKDIEYIVNDEVAKKLIKKGFATLK